MVARHRIVLTGLPKADDFSIRPVREIRRYKIAPQEAAGRAIWSGFPCVVGSY